MFDKALFRRLTRRSFLAGLGATTALPILAACQPQVVTEERVVVVEKEVPVERVVTQIVEKTVQQVITVEVEKAVEVEKVITVEVEKAIEVIKKEIVEVEKVVIVEKEVIVEVEVAAPKGYQKMDATLRITHWWGEIWQNFFEMMEEKTGIKVKDEGTAFSGYFQKVLTQLVGGTAPDLVLLRSLENATYFSSGALLPYDDWLKSAGVDNSKWGVDPRLENGWEGKIMGLSPFVMQAQIVHINLELAEKDGLLKDAPLWGRPNFDMWRWQDFVAWLKAGTKVSSDGTVEQYGLASALSSFNDWVRGYVVQNGGQIFDDVWNYQETECLINEPEALEGIQYAVDLNLKHKVQVAPDIESSIQGGSYRAKRGVAAVSWSSTSVYPEEATFPQTWMHLPWSKKPQHSIGGNYLSVNKASKEQDAALHWSSTWHVDRDTAQKYLDITGAVPGYDPLPIVGVQPEGSAKTVALITLSRIKGMSTVPQNAANTQLYMRTYGRSPGFVRDTLTDAFQASVIEDATVKDAFTFAKEKIDAEVAKTL